ncbi:hypothetical protein A2U01_0076622, partial [Trifolium medium]|nr:hypothetical protein [Trifolium medium]
GVLSKSDKNLKSASEHIEKNVPAYKSNDADENVIDVDNFIVEGNLAEKTHTFSISKRLRSNSSKVVVSDSEPTQTTKETRKT